MYTHWHSHGSKDSWKVTVKQQAASLYFRFYAEPLSQNLIRISKNGLGIPYTSPPADSYVCKNSGYPYFKAFIICDFHADKTSNSGLQIAKPSLKRQRQSSPSYFRSSQGATEPYFTSWLCSAFLDSSLFSVNLCISRISEGPQQAPPPCPPWETFQCG